MQLDDLTAHSFGELVGDLTRGRLHRMPVDDVNRRTPLGQPAVAGHGGEGANDGHRDDRHLTRDRQGGCSGLERPHGAGAGPGALREDEQRHAVGEQGPGHPVRGGPSGGHPSLALASIDREGIEEHHRCDGVQPVGEEVVGSGPGCQVLRQPTWHRPEDERCVQVRGVVGHDDVGTVQGIQIGNSVHGDIGETPHQRLEQQQVGGLSAHC